MIITQEEQRSALRAQRESSEVAGRYTQARNVRRRLDDDLVDYDAFGDEDAPQEEEDEIESDQEQNEPDHESVGSGVIGERETV